MSYIISVEGGRAVGKTTLLKKLEAKLHDVEVIFEDNSNIYKIIAERNLDKYKKEDYVEIQRIFIHHEIERYVKSPKNDMVILDLGPKEIEFF